MPGHQGRQAENITLNKERKTRGTAENEIKKNRAFGNAVPHDKTVYANENSLLHRNLSK